VTAAAGPGPRAGALRAGRLLVANPLLPDPNFDRTVILLIAYGTEGALGLVLNRPSQMDVGEPLPQWEHLAAAPAVLFLGGPVQHQSVICLARGEKVPTGPEGDQDRSGPDPLEEAWKEVVPEVGTLDLDQDPTTVAGRVRQVRLFAGYAGWSAGQLEGELDAGAWWVVDAEPGDPFSMDPDLLWKHVLRRQPNSLLFVSYFPDDPVDN
jgi:putative transcriptional regulator